LKTAKTHGRGPDGIDLPIKQEDYETLSLRQFVSFLPKGLKCNAMPVGHPTSYRTFIGKLGSTERSVSFFLK
jgi:hypothetical protein